jgi:hypothetical protein
MLVPMTMQATDDGGVYYITSLVTMNPRRNGLGLVHIPHVKVFHFFHGIDKFLTGYHVRSLMS